ncbi:MAG: hypothetical protein U5K27_02875 [Desulfotignum sp.]|nr:hypothetical protein [Desulfotignum sp.]
MEITEFEPGLQKAGGTGGFQCTLVRAMQTNGADHQKPGRQVQRKGRYCGNQYLIPSRWWQPALWSRAFSHPDFV